MPKGIDISIKEKKSDSKVDKDLIIAFLKLTPEQRIISNNNAVKAIKELQNSFRKTKKSGI